MKDYYVYILASKKDGVLYTGVTNNLMKRVYEHKNKITKGFTEKCFVGKLVYFEHINHIEEAIAREKCIKRWKREWKIRLINSINPEWKDLYYEYDGKEIDKVLDSINLKEIYNK